MVSITCVIKITALETSKFSRISRISRSNWIKASIVFRLYFCDLVTKLMLSNK